MNFNINNLLDERGSTMLKLNHKKLKVWQLSLDFVSLVYQTTSLFPKVEIYGITNQLRRAAVSLPSNIAEGASINSLQERNRFYEIARSSLVEIDTQIELSKRLAYCKKEDLLALEEQMNHLFAMLSNMIKRSN